MTLAPAPHPLDPVASPPARVVVLGRPGSGKGTQSVRVARSLEVPHISTGDLLRTEIAEGTLLGRAIEPYVHSGRLVPDEFVLGALDRRLSAPDARERGFVLDGFPRSIVQAVRLDDLITPARIDVAVELLLSEREAAYRLSTRFVCEQCKWSPTADSRGRLAPRECRRCRRPLRRRADDDCAVVRQRFVEFEQHTKPLLEWLDQHGRLVTVDADQAPDAVAADVVAGLATAGVSRTAGRPRGGR